jgi:hypothetical protein
MSPVVKSSALVVTALWVGVLFCLGFVVAPYLFVLAAKNSPAVPNTGVAAELIGLAAALVCFVCMTQFRPRVKTVAVVSS